MSRRINHVYRGVNHVNGRYGPLLGQLCPTLTPTPSPTTLKAADTPSRSPAHTQRAGLAWRQPARFTAPC